MLIRLEHVNMDQNISKLDFTSKAVQSETTYVIFLKVFTRTSQMALKLCVFLM